MGTVVNAFAIAECLQTAGAIEADLRRLIAGLTEAQFHAPPRGGGWSIGQCIEHLVLTGRAFLPKWDTALRDARNYPCHSAQRVLYRWWQRAALRLVGNPSSLKRKTPPPFSPCARYSIEETLVRFDEMRRELTRRVTGARDIDVRRAKVRSPFASWLRYELGFSFDLVLAHERRHLRQAWRVRRELSQAW